MKIKDIYQYKLFTNVPFTPIYGLGRSSLAIGTLITLLFTDFDLLVDFQLLHKFNQAQNSIIKLNLFTLVPIEYIHLCKVLAIIVLLFVISGYYPRFTGILHWWIAFSFNSTSVLVDGGDQLASVLTLLLIPVTMLDGRVNHWDTTLPKSTRNTNLVANCFLLIIALQMSIVYLHAGTEKLYKLNEWVSGTAIYYFFNDPLFGSPDWSLPLLAPIMNSKLVFFMCWAVIILELTLAGALFMEKSKKLKLFYIAILFHVLIIINLGLVSFFFSMAGGLIIYLLPDDLKISSRHRSHKLMENLKSMVQELSLIRKNLILQFLKRKL